MAAQDNSRRGGEYDGAQYDGAVPDRYDSAGHGGGIDALMAAITDEPLPEGALDDAGFAAEHRAAVADVALLREQLTLLGDTLANGPTPAETVAAAEDPVQAEAPDPTPAPKLTESTESTESTEPIRLRAPKRKRRRGPGIAAVGFGTLAAAVVATLIIGMGWLVAQSGGGSMSADSGAAQDEASGRQGDREDASKSSMTGYVACARLIVEGTVAEVEPVPNTEQNRITLDVERYYKPDKGEDEIVFVMDRSTDPRLHEGDHALLGFPPDMATPDMWANDEQQIEYDRAGILDALPMASDQTCE
ncbi:hypothetical protein [Streptomyces sp. NPDC002845]